MSNPAKIYTDGCNNKTGSGWGYVLLDINDIITSQKNQHQNHPNTLTNQQAELTAIYNGLNDPNIHKNNYWHLYTDSEYSLKSCTVWVNQWRKLEHLDSTHPWKTWKNSQNKPVLNSHLIYQIITRIAELQSVGINIQWYHIYSHQHNYWNDYVDKLCKLII